MNAKTGKRRSLVLLALTVAVLVAGALVLDRFHLPLDLTSSGSYSLSSYSRGLARTLEDRLLITYYISPELEARHPGPRQVEDYLRKFEAAGLGKIAVSVADPSSDAGALEGLGLKAQRMQVVENNEARIAMVYSGVVVQYRGRSEVLPFVIGLDGLEYGVVKAIDRAVTGRTQVAAVLVGDADKDWQQQYQNFAQALSQAGWQVRNVAAGEAIPEEAAVLVVLGNNDLDDYAAYRVDAWLASGKPAFMAVHGVSVDTSQGLYASPLRQDALLASLGKYGVKVGRSLVLDQASRTLPFQEPNAAGGSGVRYVRYPHWIVALAADSDRKNPLIKGFTGLDLMWSSPLELSAPPGVTASSVVRTTKKAWLQTKDFAVGPEDDSRYGEEAASTTGQYTLVASLSGTLPEAYAGRPAPVKAGAEPLPPLPPSPRPTRLFIVGSSDFATDLMEFTDSTFNAAFASNAVEWAAWGDDLAALKARGSRDPGLNKVQDPARKLSLEFLAIGLNVALIPGGLAVYGFFRLRRRKLLAQAGSAGGNASAAQGTASGGAAADAAPASTDAAPASAAGAETAPAPDGEGTKGDAP